MFETFPPLAAIVFSIAMLYALGVRFRLRVVQTAARKLLWFAAAIWTIGLCQHATDAPTITALVITFAVWVAVIGCAVSRRTHRARMPAGPAVVRR